MQVILPLADICLPNQFEAELLTEKKIQTEEEAREVMDLIHSRGPHTVILSSTELGSENFLLGLASRVTEGVKTVVRVEIPKFPAAFVGEDLPGAFSRGLVRVIFHSESLRDELEITPCPHRYRRPLHCSLHCLADQD